jgi:uncharacterized YigZ family protein
MIDIYKTIKDLAIGEFKDKGSKFHAYAYPIEEEEEVKANLEDLKKEHPKSRHLCYAYRIGIDGNRFRANDDGEPSGTAGRPILGQIDSFELTNVLIVVVRYFGGTKLGVPGLINAYKTAATSALEQVEIVEKTINRFYELVFDYAIMSDVMSALKKNDIQVLNQDFQEQPKITISIRKSLVEEKLNALEEVVNPYGMLEKSPVKTTFLKEA